MANKWTIFVRKYAKQHNMSYASAFNNSKARDAYKKYKDKQEAGGTKVSFRGKSYLVRTNKKVVDLSTNKETDLKYNQEGGVIIKPSNFAQGSHAKTKTKKRRAHTRNISVTGTDE